MVFRRRKEEKPKPVVQEESMPVVQEVAQDQTEDDVEPDNDSPDNLEFFSDGTILRTMRANIRQSSQAGPNIKTKRGIMLALDTTPTPGLFRLDLHGKTIAQFFLDIHAGGV